MKYKKYNYILVLILTIFFKINLVLADTVDCTALFGDKNDPNSIRYLINEILQYPKIIVPILIIVLGMLDFAKAAIASKDDEIKKAQSTFIKRLIAGVVVFLVPIIIDILMGFADIVWAGLGYTSCGL